MEIDGLLDFLDHEGWLNGSQPREQRDLVTPTMDLEEEQVTNNRSLGAEQENSGKRSNMTSAVQNSHSELNTKSDVNNKEDKYQCNCPCVEGYKECFWHNKPKKTMPIETETNSEKMCENPRNNSPMDEFDIICNHFENMDKVNIPQKDNKETQVNMENTYESHTYDGEDVLMTFTNEQVTRMIAKHDKERENLGCHIMNKNKELEETVRQKTYYKKKHTELQRSIYKLRQDQSTEQNLRTVQWNCREAEITQWKNHHEELLKAKNMEIMYLRQKLHDEKVYAAKQTQKLLQARAPTNENVTRTLRADGQPYNPWVLRERNV
jgi:hypothetical protein